MSGNDIFLSYSREDRAAARHFAESFAREGFSVWWDAALRSGQTFDEVIEKELRAAKAVVVLWSPRSVASRWVRAEATLADRRNKLVPAIIEDCDRPIIFELTHAADLADWTGDTSDSRWQTLVSDLRRLVGGKDEAPAQPKAAEPAEEPAAKPKPVPTAIPRRADRVEARVEARQDKSPPKSEPSDNIDDLLFARSRLRNAGARSSRPEPRPAEESDHTQFYKRPSAADAHAAEEVHCLEMIDQDRPETRFIVSPLGLRIGRTAPADIVLADNGVSRAHCVVELAGHQLRVLDMNSTNGTFIDDERIEGAAVLAVGSVLRVGKVSFTHEIRSRAELDLLGNAANLNRGPNLRVAGLAGSS